MMISNFFVNPWGVNDLFGGQLGSLQAMGYIGGHGGLKWGGGGGGGGGSSGTMPGNLY